MYKIRVLIEVPRYAVDPETVPTPRLVDPSNPSVGYVKDELGTVLKFGTPVTRTTGETETRVLFKGSEKAYEAWGPHNRFAPQYPVHVEMRLKGQSFSDLTAREPAPRRLRVIEAHP